MTLAPPPGERALPLLAGALLALAHPPFHLLLPPFLGLAPLLVFIAQRPPGPAGRWAATRAGLVTGVVYFGLQLYWMVVALLRTSLLAIPAYLGAVVVLAGLVGAFGWAVHRAREQLGLPLWLLAAIFWTTLEWVQAHLGPLSFPWLGLGTALAPYPVLAGGADLVGARGLTAWLAAVNGVVAMAYLELRGTRQDTRPLRPALRAVLVGILVVAPPVAYGAIRATTLELRPVARVALIQPNIGEELKLDRSVALDTSLSTLRTLTRSVAAGGADLVVWPEVALPAELDGDPALLDEVRALSATASAPILVGAWGVERQGDDAIAYNSAFLVGPDGVRGPRYDKQRLVPFVERVPFVDAGGLERWVGELRYYGGLGRGRDAPLFRTDAGATFGVLICFESAFAPLAREHRAAGADFLVNITNDAWYGRDEWWGRTTALWQHPAHLVLRAIETRTGVARAANTGISMLIDPLGRVRHATELFEAAAETGVVLGTDGTTVFVRWGDWVGTLAVVAAMLIVVGGTTNYYGSFPIFVQMRSGPGRSKGTATNDTKASKEPKNSKEAAR